MEIHAIFLLSSDGTTQVLHKYQWHAGFTAPQESKGKPRVRVVMLCVHCLCIRIAKPRGFSMQFLLNCLLVLCFTMSLVQSDSVMAADESHRTIVGYSSELSVTFGDTVDRMVNLVGGGFYKAGLAICSHVRCYQTMLHASAAHGIDEAYKSHTQYEEVLRK
jgi:hypothetical protein